MNIIQNQKPNFVLLIILFTLAVTTTNGKSLEFEESHHRTRRAGNLFVSFYEHENYRGQVYQQRIAKECGNLPSTYDNWASSVILHDRCVTLCDLPNCQGQCTEVIPNEKGKKRLSDLGLNDKISSVKYCFKFV